MGQDTAVPTLPVGLCFNDLTDASWPHGILGSECEFIPGATFEVLKAVGTLAGADGEVPPLLAVVLRVLQNVAFRRRTGVRRKLQEPDKEPRPGL